MKRHIKILTILLLVSFQSWAQQAVVSVKSDTNAILIGEQVKLGLHMDIPQGKTPLFPVFHDTLTSALEIIGKTPIDTLVNTETGMKSLRQTLIITSFDTGYFVIPPIPFGIMKPGDTTYQVLQSDPLLLNVFSVEVDTTKEIKPIIRPMAEPYTLLEFLPIISLVFAVAIIIFAIFYFIRRKKKNKPFFAKKEKPLLPPHEEALLHLDELKRKKLWQNDRLKEYHTELTDIVRRYMERRFGIQAMEMVSADIMDELKKERVNDNAFSKIRASFELADLVKFAKSGATPIENDTSYHNCVDFVNETKQAIIPEEKKVEVVKGEEVKDVQ
jgi:hypothetical protein